MTKPLFVCYPNCTTCRKAKKWLDEQGVTISGRNIAQDNPSIDEIREWHKKSGLPLKRFFNTSGGKYRELSLKDKLPKMSEDEQYKLLASDGMLIRRPILAAKDFVLVGFKEAEWQEHLAGRKPSAEKEARPPVRAYRLKVTLRGMKPPVWRRVVVPEDMTFSELAKVLIIAMGWNGSHLSAFEMPKSGMNIMADPWADEEQFGERNGLRVRLSQYLPEEKNFLFVYDMGDNWEHAIVVEEVLDAYEGDCPAVTAYMGNCPPDDCGGVWGYMELLAENDEDTKAWLAETGDYDIGVANAMLQEADAAEEDIS